MGHRLHGAPFLIAKLEYSNELDSYEISIITITIFISYIKLFSNKNNSGLSPIFQNTFPNKYMNRWL